MISIIEVMKTSHIVTESPFFKSKNPKEVSKLLEIAAEKLQLMTDIVLDVYN